MSQATDRVLGAVHTVTGPARPPAPKDEAYLLDALKRCSPATRRAACEFRRTGSAHWLRAVVGGIIEHYVEPDVRSKLCRGGDDLRLVEDLAVDSLTMLEIVYLAEDVLQISVENEDLRPLRTVRDVKEFLASKVQGEFARALETSSGSPG
jgi:3-hydroxyacyl-[acyl-carrier-protein] dehydratase